MQAAKVKIALFSIRNIRYVWLPLQVCLDHSCNKYCNLIGQEEVTNCDRHLHDFDRHLQDFDTQLHNL